MVTKGVIAVLLVLLVAAPSAAQPVPQPEVWRTLASRLDAGSRVKLRLLDGQRLSGTLIEAVADHVVVQPRTRVPVPAQQVRYDAIVSLERDDASGIGVGKAVAIGVGAGAGTFFGIFLFLLAALD